MTEHHPAVAEQISAHETAIAECTASLAHHEREHDRLMTELHGHECMLAAYIDAEQRLIAAMKFSSVTVSTGVEGAPVVLERYPATSAKRMKRDVRGAVMACFAAEGNHLLSENFVIERTGLPESSVHAYLGRAVRAGEVEREGDLYRLPDRPTKEDNIIWTETPTAKWATTSASAWTPPPQPASTEAITITPWPPSPEKIIDTIRRAGDMGMSAAQLQIIGATDDQLDELLSAGHLDYQDEDRRYRIAEDREEVAP